jgi:divalent metal cation (Fe/Co/Zn/Cd) transporter
VHYHALRTREAAGRSFVGMHILVPGEWTVKRAHDLADEIEASIGAMLPHTCVTTHIEPVDDPVSYRDIELDR